MLIELDREFFLIFGGQGYEMLARDLQKYMRHYIDLLGDFERDS